MSLTVRPVSVDEAPGIQALLHEHALASFGEPELSEEEVRSWFGQQNLEFRVAEHNGELVGYLDVQLQESGRFPADVRTLDADAAALLLGEAEEIGRERDATVVRSFVQGDDPVFRPVLEDLGWRPIRYSFEDWREFNVDRHSFDPSLWWLVEDGDELAAISLNAWHFSGDPQYGWIHVLGVRPQWRKRGLATALLHHSFRDFRERGATRVGLGVDGENTTGAVRLYERVGMRPVRRNDTYEKTL